MLTEVKKGNRISAPAYSGNADSNRRIGTVVGVGLSGFEVRFDNGNTGYYFKSDLRDMEPASVADHAVKPPLEGIMYQGIQAMSAMTIAQLAENRKNFEYCAQGYRMIKKPEYERLLAAHLAFCRVRMLEADLEVALKNRDKILSEECARQNVQRSMAQPCTVTYYAAPLWGYITHEIITGKAGEVEELPICVDDTWIKVVAPVGYELTNVDHARIDELLNER